MKLKRLWFTTIFVALGGILLLDPAGAWCQSDAVRVSGDGSLCLRGSAPSAEAAHQIKDLLASQVQVYLFKSSSRVWSSPLMGKGYVYAVQGRGRSLPLRDPQIASMIDAQARRYGVDSNLVRAVMRHESGYNPNAVSPKGAMGLMQLMPGTASLMGVNDPFDPEQNIAGGVKYLKYCLSRFNYDVPLALAAYNAGPLNVMKYQGLPPFAETQQYVASVMQTYTKQATTISAPTAPIGGQGEQKPEAASRKGVKSRSHTSKPARVSMVSIDGKTRVAVVQAGKAKVINILR